jgi:CRP/FNR family cyclic AMP-dependent transcriptional regulator
MPGQGSTESLASLLTRISGSATRIELPRGAVVIRQGQEDAPVCLILEGTFKLVCDAPDGRSAIVGLGFPGSLLGAAATLAVVPSPAAAVSITPSRVQVTARAAFLSGIAAYPDLASVVLRMHAAELCRFTSDIASYSSLPAKGRLIRFLAALSAANGSARSDGFVRIGVPLSHEDMADATGSSREHVTRLLHQLHDESIVRQTAGWIWVRASALDEEG